MQLLPDPYCPQFDHALQCWSLRSYADVRRALEDPRFAISLTEVDEVAHSLVLRRGFAGFDIGVWKQELLQIPFVSDASELVSDVAEPWCNAAAQRLVGLTTHQPALLDLSRSLFAAGATPWAQHDPDIGLRLAAILPPVLGAMTVQGFVAVSQTLTAFLANAWAAMLAQNLLEAPLEELLRFAGPSQFQFRYFQGTRIALCTGAANCDVSRFGEDADRLNPHRDARGHLAFGHGPHACLGAMLVRAAASVAMPLFARHYGGAKLLALELPDEPVAICKPLAVRIGL